MTHTLTHIYKTSLIFLIANKKERKKTMIKKRNSLLQLFAIANEGILNPQGEEKSMINAEIYE